MVAIDRERFGYGRERGLLDGICAERLVVEDAWRKAGQIVTPEWIDRLSVPFADLLTLRDDIVGELVVINGGTGFWDVAGDVAQLIGLDRRDYRLGE